METRFISNAAPNIVRHQPALAEIRSHALPENDDRRIFACATRLSKDSGIFRPQEFVIFPS